MGALKIEITDIKNQFPKVRYFELSDGIDIDSFKNSKKISYYQLIYKYVNKKFDNISDIIFSMGRLHKIKGYDNLIKSFALLLREKPNSKLLIAGSGDTYKYELISLIKKLRLENSVFLVGQLNDEEKRSFI